MGRQRKPGFDYFALDTKFDIEVEALISAKGGIGLALWITILQLVYSNGWYSDWGKTREIFISGKIGINPEETRLILELLFDLDLFSREKFQDHGVITGHGVQRRYLAMCNTSKKIPEKHAFFWIIPELMCEIPLNARVIPGTMPQSKVNESKSEERKENQNGVEFFPEKNDSGKEEIQYPPNHWEEKFKEFLNAYPESPNKGAGAAWRNFQDIVLPFDGKPPLLDAETLIRRAKAYAEFTKDWAYDKRAHVKNWTLTPGDWQNDWEKDAKDQQAQGKAPKTGRESNSDASKRLAEETARLAREQYGKG